MNVAYSAEFRDRTANETLLASLAAKSDDGPTYRAAADRDESTTVPPVDFFRHDLPLASGRRDLWPELTLAAVGLFVGDVFVRRVAFEWHWLALPFAAAWARLRRNRGRIVAPEYMERLRERKASVVRQASPKTGRQGDEETRRPNVPTVAVTVKHPEPPPTLTAPPAAPSPKPDAANDYTARAARANARRGRSQERRFAEKRR